MESTPVDQCVCQSVSEKLWCGVSPCLSMTRSSGTSEEMEAFLRGEHGWEGNQKSQLQKGTSSTEEKSVCVRSESVVRSRCATLSLHSTSDDVDIELEDEAKKFIGLSAADGKLLRKTSMERAAHLRNGLPHGSVQQPRARGWALKGAAPSRYGRVAKGFAHLRLSGRVLNVGTALLRKKINRLDKQLAIVHTIAHEDANGATHLKGIIAPHPVGVVVVAEVEVDGGEGVVARATVDFGVEGDPIEVGVLTPMEYVNLVFNVVPNPPLAVDADYL